MIQLQNPGDYLEALLELLDLWSIVNGDLAPGSNI